MTARPEDRDPRPLIGARVSVHYNLHRGGYVIAAKPGAPVAGYADTVELAEVTFRVSAAGRARVLRTGARSVHAYAIGRLVSLDAPTPDLAALDRITYNPRRSADAFELAADGTPVHTAGRAWFAGRYAYVPKG